MVLVSKFMFKQRLLRQKLVHIATRGLTFNNNSQLSAKKLTH